MDTRKVALIATIAIIALIAVGIGYAYTASTVNENNNAGREFVELSQSGTGQYQFSNGFEVYYDSANSGTRTTNSTVYQLTDNVDVGVIFPGQTVVQLGDPFTLKASQVGGDGDDLTCVFTTTNFNIDNSWKFYIKVNNGETITNFTTTASNMWNNDAKFTIEKIAESTGSYKDVEIEVYYGYPTNDKPTYTAGSKPSNIVLNNASLTFTVEINGSNITTSWPGNTTVTTTTSIAWTGNDIDLPAVTVKIGETTLIENTDYTTYWTGPNGVAVTKLHDSGVYTFTVTGKGTYVNNGFVYGTCVVGQELPALTITFDPETQTTAVGTAPSITVKNGESVFNADNYTSAWKNADGTAIDWTSAGTKILTLTGAKGYYGTTAAEFEVTAPTQG